MLVRDATGVMIEDGQAPIGVPAPEPAPPGGGFAPMAGGFAGPQPGAMPGATAYNPDPMVMQTPSFGNGFTNFMSSPGMAMAQQAMLNTAALRRGQVPTQTPFSAMYDVRKQNQVLMDRKFEMNEQKRQFDEAKRYRDAQTQALEFKLQQEKSMVPNIYANLTNDMQEWKMSGAEARGVPFEKFIESKNPQYYAPAQPTSAMQNYSTYMGLPEEQRADFAGFVRAMPVVEGGGGSQFVRGIDGKLTEVISSDEAITREGNLAEEKEGSKNWGKYDAEFAQALPGTQETLKNLYGFTEEMLREFEGKDLKTQSGLIQGRFGPLIDETAGYIDTMSSILTVPALAEARLAPVTVQEWEAIKGTFVDFKRDPAANIGALRAQLAMLKPKLALAEDQWRYYQKNGTMRDYARGRSVQYPNYGGGGGGSSADGMIDDSDAPPL